MTVTFRPARREDVQLIVGLAGSSGSGKTMSALRIARGLAGDRPFAVIDTERGRALHYGDDFQPWEHAELEPPFRPDAYAEAITTADEAGYPVIVIDSFSHEHAGDGGLLDWHDEEVQRMAGDDARRREQVKIAAWIAPKTSHKRLVSKLLQVKAHLIICLRAEQQIEIGKENGKTVIRPKRSLVGIDGWVPVAEKSLAYELTASFLLTADQPGVPKPIKLPERIRAFMPLDQPLSEETGRLLGEWAAGHGSDDVDALVQRLLELATQAGKLDATSKAIGEKPRDAAWVKRQIKRLEESLAGEGGIAEPRDGEGADVAAAVGSTNPAAATPPSPESDEADTPQFEIPVGARQDDQG